MVIDSGAMFHKKQQQTITEVPSSLSDIETNQIFLNESTPDPEIIVPSKTQFLFQDSDKSFNRNQKHGFQKNNTTPLNCESFQTSINLSNKKNDNKAEVNNRPEIREDRIEIVEIDDMPQFDFSNDLLNLSEFHHQEVDKNGDNKDQKPKSNYIYVMSGYCDEPLTLVERLNLDT